MLFFFEISTKKFYFDFWQTQLLLFYKSKLLFINPNKLLTSLNSYEKNDSNISIISLNLLLQLYYIYNIYYKLYLLLQLSLQFYLFFHILFNHFSVICYTSHTHAHTRARARRCVQKFYTNNFL